MAKTFSRGQTQILYRYLPLAIFDHDDYGLCRVEEVVLEETDEINRTALFDALLDALRLWDREDFRSSFPDPRTEHGQKRYRVGQPKEVRFEPFPRVLLCRKCKHVVEYKRVDKKAAAPGVCPRSGCGGQMQQMPYVEAHNCGRLEEMYIPAKGCPKHGHLHIRFYDPGRTAAAKWMCGVCGTEIQKPRMTPCKCAYSAAVPELGRSQYEKFMRLYPTSEPGLYIPHVVALINFREKDEKQLSQVESGLPLLLARQWGILDRNVLEIIDERKRWAPGNADVPPHIKGIIEALRKANPEDPTLREYEKCVANPPGQDAINTVQGLMEGALLNGPAPRRLVEHVALKDTMRLTGINTVIQRLRENGHEEQAGRFGTESERILKELGLHAVHVINDFPIALTALGYTRVTRDPHRSVFNAFPPDEDGKIPLFVIPTETEGLWFQLDPVAVAGWLRVNGLLAPVPPENRVHSWALLYREVLRSNFSNLQEISPAAEAILMLVHTMSHTLLQKIEWSGFSASSIGEYLMPETLSFVVYANRYAESKVGGLTTLFEQRLPLWLHDAAQSGRECVYDPLCKEDGGSCVGCLHREHNCPLFNERLSRAVLFSGPVPSTGKTGITTIRDGYWEGFLRRVAGS